MSNIEKKLGIVFDTDDNAVISREKLFQIIHQCGICTVMSEITSLPERGYMLIDNVRKEVYLFSEEELKIWEKDGSLEKGDSLYKIAFMKKIADSD